MVVEGTLSDSSLPRALPLIHSLVRSDVSDALGVHLYETGGVVSDRVYPHPVTHLDEGIVAQTGACQGGCGSEEARVRNFFDGFSDGQNESSVSE